MRIRPCEGRGPGSIPGEDIPFLTLEPDGQATGCNPVQVGSTPTGVSDLAQIDCDGGICSPTTQTVRIPPSLARRSGVGWKAEQRP
jgi:hypothetical protein